MDTRAEAIAKLDNKRLPILLEKKNAIQEAKDAYGKAYDNYIRNLEDLNAYYDALEKKAEIDAAIAKWEAEQNA